MAVPLLIFTLIVFFGLLSYYLIFSCLSLAKQSTLDDDEKQGVSLIICAKNEAENLSRFIPIWIKQTGVEFELIVVNDGSIDQTAEVLLALQKKYPTVKVIHLAPKQLSNLKGKRRALLAGIEKSSYDFVVLSDADCYPISQRHLAKMLSRFKPGVDIVLGYSPYEKRKGLLNKFIQIETTLTALQYLSFAFIGIPYMGVGRNIAYRKAILNERVFQKSNRTLSGDDDLLLAEVATRSNTMITLDLDNLVYTLPPSSFGEWMKQKQRHYSTAKYYNLLKIILVGGFPFLSILFYFALFLFLINDFEWTTVLSIYLAKWIIFVMFNYRNLQMLQNRRIIGNILFLDFFWVVFLIFNHFKALKANNGWS
jgi:glycosyltransferase involved in cell wall biosynthesis